MAYGDGTWTRNTSGSWSLSVSINGVRYKRTGDTKTEARAKIEALRVSLADRQRRRSDPTVREILAEFMGRELPSRGRAPSTVERHRWASALVAESIGDRRVSDLRVRDVEQMLDELADRPLSSASLGKVRNHLSQALKFASRDDDLIRDVAIAAKTPHSPSTSKPRRALSADEAMKLERQLLTERNGLAFVVMLRLGLRPGEAFGLCWDSVDVDAGTVNIVRAVRRDRRGRTELSDDLKTKSARRTLAVPASVVSEITRHRDRQTEERAESTRWVDDRLVFASPRGTVVDPAKSRSILRDACRAAGVDEVAPNELRHTCATLLSDAGVQNELIADLLGHTSTRMVDQTYRHRIRPVIDVASQAAW